MLAIFSGLAPRWSGLCAGALLLGLGPASYAQPAAEPTNAEAAPAPEAAPPPEATPPAEATPPPVAPPAVGPSTRPPEPPVVAAQPAEPARETTRPYSLGATLSSSLLSETNSTSFVTAPLIEGAYAVRARVLLDLKLGFAWLVDNQGLGESTFRAGNPQLAGHYHDQAGPWQYDVGLGVTAPLADVPLGPDGRLYESLYNRTLAMWGMWNQWLWLVGRMAVPAMFRVSYGLPGGQVLVLQQSDALVVGVTGNASGTDFVAQAAFEAQIPIGSRFTICARLQTVLLPSASIDRWQSAAALRGTVATSVGRFFAGVLFNLDEPLGALAGGARWGFHLGKEVDL
jgi:hypothetical protein